jgi:DNA (cytosine-5)-methyltransferase 1
MTLPLIIDSFAGGGGASTGIEMAFGRSPDIAINHDAAALSMHQVNHPATRHLNTSIWKVDPRAACGDHRVALAWFSPDCKHHSKAKGGKPVKRNIRDLAWIVVYWAKMVRPQVILLENVEEFEDWGPLTEDMKPCPKRRGQTFNFWVEKLRRLGYTVDWRQLRACDYGAPTIRKRLFLVARCDGLPIVWPEPTHGAPDDMMVRSGQLKPWRNAADIIDWSLPCPSIFDTSAEIMEKHGLRAVRPLADNTLRRIARGVQRYVIEDKQPFVVTYGQHGGAVRSGTAPLHTVTASPKDQNAIIVPSLTSFYGHGTGGTDRSHSPEVPLATLTTANRHAIIAPSLIQTGYGEAKGQKPRTLDLHKPIGTLVAGGGKHALVSAFLAQHNTGLIGRRAAAPLSTLTTTGAQQTVIAAHLMTMRNSGKPFQGAAEPTHTITAGGAHTFAVAAHLMNMHGTQRSARPVDAPNPSICAGGNHGALVAAFLTKYYGQGVGQSLTAPAHTVATRDTFGLVTVEIDGATYAIADIGMRMLTPREQFRAQGFPDSYIIDHGAQGERMTSTQQIRMCGNSVCPPLAAALASANRPASMQQEIAA